jgi:Concanavalin A-like lectin/glucanases superfamily
MSTWVKFTPAQAYGDTLHTIISHGYTLSPDAEVMLRIYNGYYSTGSWNGASGYGVTVPIPFTDYNNWVHLTAEYDGSKWMLYDGAALLGSSPAPYGALNVNADWMIGSSTQASDPRYFNGLIDDARIDARALSPQEIMAQSQPLISGPTTIVEGQPIR